MFAIHHFVRWTCPDCENSHEEVIPLPVIYSLRAKDIQLASWYSNCLAPGMDTLGRIGLAGSMDLTEPSLGSTSQANPSLMNSSTSSLPLLSTSPPPNLADYLAHFIPCRPMGNKHHGSDPIHDLPPPACSQDGCSALRRITSIQTAWPRMLHILPETMADTHNAFLARQPRPVIFERILSIPRLSSPPVNPEPADSVEYSLVGRILYKPGHFTAEYLIDERTFSYDSATNGGRLKDIGGPDLCTAPRHDVVMYIYTLSGERVVSSRNFPYKFLAAS